MSSHAEPRPERPALPGAQSAVPFHVFVLVCDRDKTVAPRAVLEFQKILAGRPRGASPLFLEMLEHCRESYPALWRDYASSKVPIDLSGFVELLGLLQETTGLAEFAELERDLAGLATTLFRASFLLRPRPAQQRAYDEFMTALRERALPEDADSRRTGRADVVNEDRPGSVRSAPPFAPRPVVDSRPLASREATRDRPPTRVSTALLALPHPGETWVKGPIRLVCTKIAVEARDVKTLSFTGLERRWFHYEPGQFLTIEPVIDGKKLSRPYTISSTPTRPALLEITVKRVLGGLVSNWLHDHMRVGQELDARGPFGKFSCLRVPSDKYLFLAAGSGITPLMSMLRYLHDVAAPVDVVFLQSAKTEQDLIFRKELDLLDHRSPGFRVALTLTDPPAGGAWDGLRGRLDNEMLHRIAPDLEERRVLACGPSGFLDKLKQLLAGNGFPLATRFDEESFLPKPARGPGGSADAANAGPSRRIRFVRSGKAVDILAGETILDAAERCGLSIPSACRQGRCGTCRVVKVSGEVSMPEQEALSPEEMDLGEILACIAQPASGSIEVDF